MQVDLIIHDAAQMITCASRGKAKRGGAMLDVGLIKSGALAISAGKIVATGTTAEINQNYQSEIAIDARGKVVMPGFVDCHTHVVFAGNRLDEFELKIKGVDYLEILQSGGGILSTVEKTRNASLDELIEESKKRLDAMLSHGTTTAEIKSGYGLNTQTELKMLEAIARLDQIHAIDLVPTFLGAHAIPSEYKDNADEYVDLVCTEMIEHAMQWYEQSHFLPGEIPFFADVFCEHNAFSLAQSQRVLQAAIDKGFKIKAHVDEFTNLGGAQMAMELNATSIDHLDATSNQEVKLLAYLKTIAVVTPTVNFNFGKSHFADVRKMIDDNCAVAISTDYNPGSAPCPSLPMTMAIACRYQKLLPTETLNAATINAAFAVGLGDKVGSLEVGKQADALILGTNDYRTIAYEFGSNLIETIIKKGKVV
jgi:imidazolonepropionase